MDKDKDFFRIYHNSLDWHSNRRDFWVVLFTSLSIPILFLIEITGVVYLILPLVVGLLILISTSPTKPLWISFEKYRNFQHSVNTNSGIYWIHNIGIYALGIITVSVLGSFSIPSSTRSPNTLEYIALPIILIFTALFEPVRVNYVYRTKSDDYLYGIVLVFYLLVSPIILIVQYLSGINELKYLLVFVSFIIFIYSAFIIQRLYFDDRTLSKLAPEMETNVRELKELLSKDLKDSIHE